MSEHEEGREITLSGFHWIPSLFFRPQRFFRFFVALPHPALTALAFSLYGAATLAEPDLPELDDLRNWSTLWLRCAIFGPFCGAYLWACGGWWYRKRIELCSLARTVTPAALAKRVYVFSSLVWCLPALTYAAWLSSVYARPRDATVANTYWILIAPFLFWSAFVSYTGVITCFRVHPRRVIGWFLVGPIAAYSSLPFLW